MSVQTTIAGEKYLTYRASFPSDVFKYMMQNGAGGNSFILFKVCKYFIKPDFPLTRYHYINLGRPTGVKLLAEAKKSAYCDGALITVKEYPISNIIEKLGCCSLKRLSLKDQIVPLKDFKFLVKGELDDLTLLSTFITTDDKKWTNYSDILSMVPEITKFKVTYINELWTDDMAVKIKKSRIFVLEIQKIKYYFDFQYLVTQVMKLKPNMDIRLMILDYSDDFKIYADIHRRVHTLIEDIGEDLHKFHGLLYRAPYIEIGDSDSWKLTKMCKKIEYLRRLFDE